MTGDTMKSKILLWGCALSLLVVAGFAGYVWVALHWSYSTGERAGYVQKFSQKGWICKTWEGELTMMAVPGSIPEKFFFSVRDDKVAQSVNNSMAKRVSLAYEQHKGVPTTFFGETEYFVVGVRVQE
jgi:hypothetical protein